MPSTESRSDKAIVVVGAGVLGLSSALTLQARHPAASITIVAAEIPSLPSTWSSETPSLNRLPEANTRPSADYASMWAGAHYRPIPRSSRQLEQEHHLAWRTNEVMHEIITKHDVTDCGVAVVPALEILERPSAVEAALKTGDAYAGVDDHFRVLNDDELRQCDAGLVCADGHSQSIPNDGKGCARWACEYSSYCVNIHVYCCWLYSRFLAGGGHIIQRKLDCLERAFDFLTISANTRGLVVNCSGRNFDTDPAVKFIRGQTVLVKNEYGKTITRQNLDGSWAFLVPRPGGAGTVIGGTKEVGDDEVNARSTTRQTLLENAVKYFPDFVDSVDKFEVLMDNVGRRPWREGGLRIETETFPGKRTVVHGYGAGGRGFETSWGIAEKVADLVDIEFGAN